MFFILPYLSLSAPSNSKADDADAEEQNKEGDASKVDLRKEVGEG